ncbi:MAG: hypothetical protein Q9166_006210 [cf. Caloplaca sp. 2 TL-2023]
MISHKTTTDNLREIQDVALIDTESAVKLREGQAIRGWQVGNVLWRSPEAQTGVAVGMASDIWSFGATALCGITKRVMFAYNESDEKILPEVQVLRKMISYFGPLSQGLLDHIGDSLWGQILLGLDSTFDKENPRKPFELWLNMEQFKPGDKEFFLRVMKLDPLERPSAEELLRDPWFYTP